MNRILFYMEMRRNVRSLLLWSAVIGLLIFFTMSFFRTVLQYQQQIAGMVQLVPANRHVLVDFYWAGDGRLYHWAKNRQ